MIPKRANKIRKISIEQKWSLQARLVCLAIEYFTYVEDLLDGKVNFRIVFFGRILEICRVITDQVSEHSCLPHGIICLVCSILKIRAASICDFIFPTEKLLSDVSAHGDVNLR